MLTLKTPVPGRIKAQVGRIRFPPVGGQPESAGTWLSQTPVHCPSSGPSQFHGPRADRPVPGRKRDGNASGDPRTEEMIGLVRVDSDRSESGLSGPIREESRPGTRPGCGNAGVAPAISPSHLPRQSVGGRVPSTELSTTSLREKTNNRHIPSRRRFGPHGKPSRMNSPALSHATFKNATIKVPDDPQTGEELTRGAAEGPTPCDFSGRGCEFEKLANWGLGTCHFEQAGATCEECDRLLCCHIPRRNGSAGVPVPVRFTAE